MLDHLHQKVTWFYAAARTTYMYKSDFTLKTLRLKYLLATLNILAKDRYTWAFSSVGKNLPNVQYCITESHLPHTYTYKLEVNFVYNY